MSAQPLLGGPQPIAADTPGIPFDVVAGDVDGDRQPDVVAGFYPIDALMWYPNPLAVATEGSARAGKGLTLTAETSGPARATLRDALGRQLEVLYDAAVLAGQTYELVIDGADLAPGAYWVHLQTDSASSTQSLVRVR
ncbi:MAG: hypothetical protein Rubg2KO_20190 [Rubricoccaceae bacterium]